MPPTTTPGPGGSEAARRQLDRLVQDEKELFEKAKHAKQVGDERTLDFIKSNLKRVAWQRRLLARQLRVAETFEELAEEAEGHTSSADAKSAEEIERKIDEGLDEIERELGEA